MKIPKNSLKVVCLMQQNGSHKKFETKDMGALEVTTNKDGHLITFSNVFLYKDKKIYRHLINVVTDNLTE